MARTKLCLLVLFPMGSMGLDGILLTIVFDVLPNPWRQVPLLPRDVCLSHPHTTRLRHRRKVIKSLSACKDESLE